MEENKNLVSEEEQLQQQQMKEETSFNFRSLYTALVLNWKWFLLSLILCLGLAAVYLRYTTPIYQAYMKLLIKEDDSYSRGGKNSMLNAMSGGTLTNSTGMDNEMEILASHTVSAETVEDLKLYVTYTMSGRVKEFELYKKSPIEVDMDSASLHKLNKPVTLSITRNGNGYTVSGSCFVAIEGGEESNGPYNIEKKFPGFPETINTKAGTITFKPGKGSLGNGQTLKVSIVSPYMASYKYCGALSISPTAKGTSIASLSITDPIIRRAKDYLRQLAIVYNRQANEDKNEVAHKTEEFINQRLEKINVELGNTEGELEQYKKDNEMVQLSMNAGKSFGSKTSYEEKLMDANLQLDLLNSITDYLNQSGNRYEIIPTNIGLSDGVSTGLISQYNKIVMERKRLLKSASENNPVVEPLTQQLDELENSLRRSISEARSKMALERQDMEQRYEQYKTEVGEVPHHERMLTQIGRQQDVKSGLYLMLLEKREENSITLAATADKGKMIDEPQAGGMISPKRNMIMLIGLLAGLAIPALLIFLGRFFRYKIEGHDDVQRLTKLPIIADVAVASESAKTKADIVVHENKNNQMEEIFRSMRTNLQFMLKDNDKVVLFTSTTAGEGKTFNCANLSMSFALLGKRVLLVGLDIRKPRLAELFEINDHKHGITTLLTMDNPTREDIMANIVPSGVNPNLELLMAGPVPPNPAELIARDSLETIFDTLRKEYDYILVDTAPVGLVTDTLQISRVADATVYMCRADYTARQSFGLINHLSTEKKLPNMGIVINGIDMSKKKYGYYYGYGRYGKYGRYGSSGSYGGYSSYGYGGYGYGGYGYGNYSNSHYGNKEDNSIKR